MHELGPKGAGPGASPGGERPAGPSDRRARPASGQSPESRGYPVVSGGAPGPGSSTQERFKPKDRSLSAGPATSVSLGLGLGAPDLGGDLTGPRHGQREMPMWRNGGEAG